MSEHMLVSIIINNYNYESFLSQAIDSALAQTYPNLEVIVVDDGSTDDSCDIISSYGDRIISILKENGGQASAMNAGFSASKGDIICLLDSDDLFLPQKVSTVVNLFVDSEKEVGWVFVESAPVKSTYLLENGLQIVFEEIANKKDNMSPQWIDFRKQFLNASLPDFTPSTSNLCFSRRLLENIFPLPEIKGISGMAITDLYIKLLSAGISPGYRTTENLGIFRMHDNYYSTLHPNKKARMFAEINITTGYWMRIKYPTFFAISRKLISRGYAAFVYCKGKQFKSPDADCEKMLKDYCARVRLSERIMINALIVYYWLKLKTKKDNI